MPCEGGPSRNLKAEFAAKEQKKVNAKINNLTVMLCSACTALEQNNFDFAVNPQLDKWWTAHKLADQKRKEKELKQQEKEARQLLLRQEALELAKKPLVEMTKEEKDKLKKAGLL